MHLTEPAYIHPSTTVIVPEEVVIKLEDNAEMPKKGGTIIGIVGSVEQRIKNVKIFLDGIIDGNKEIHIKKIMDMKV